MPAIPAATYTLMYGGNPSSLRESHLNRLPLGGNRLYNGDFINYRELSALHILGLSETYNNLESLHSDLEELKELRGNLL